MEYDYIKINKEVALTGFFSEYLPNCFSLDKKILKIVPSETFDKVSPLTFTMSRYTKNQGRRTISIPEICSYLVVQNYIKEESIIKELVEFTQTSNCSFSPILSEGGDVVRHETIYVNSNNPTVTRRDDYIDNVMDKIKKSAASRAILALDVANCFGSFYMHMIPAILLGAESAQDEFLQSVNSVCEPAESYAKYSKLDKLMRGMNLDRTNGLLVGPLYSKILAEALFTRIDIELTDLKVSFSRYVDDYEVYIYDNEQEAVLNKFTTVFRKYGFSLNAEKTQLKKFPFYNSENLSRTFSNKIKFMKELYGDVNKENIEYNEFTIDLFNTFLHLEEQSVPGAVRFCLKSFYQYLMAENAEEFSCDSELFTSYLLSILQNEPRSLINVCQLLLSESPLICLSQEIVDRLHLIATEHLAKENDLEAIWLIYVLLERCYLMIKQELIVAILNSSNELAQIMIYNKELINTSDIKKLENKATSWLLLYEMYKDDDITELTLKEKLKINKNIVYYRKFKEQRIKFCNLKCEEDFQPPF